MNCRESKVIGVRPKPEEEELKLKEQELKDLENRLVEFEFQLTDLRADLGTFESLYLKIVGVRYAELDEIEAQLAEFVARRSPGDLKAQRTATEARRRAKESRASAAESSREEKGRFSPSPSLKELYREVARRVHPDLAADDADRQRRQRSMAEANNAYANGDEARLRRILEEYENSPEAVFGKGPGVDLVKVIRRIVQVKRRLAEVQAEMEQIRSSEIFQLKAKVDDGKKQGRDVLSEMAAAIQVQIARSQVESKAARERDKQ